MDTATRQEIERGIRYMTAHAHYNAVKHGFWNKPPGPPGERPDVDYYLGKLALVHSEISEAVEELRKRTSWKERKGDFTSELADVVIRIGDLAGALELPLGEKLVEKMDFNETRKHKHFGKRA